MIRHAALALLALSLGACTSGGESAFERLGPQLEALVLGDDDSAKAEPPKITRAELQEIPFATISVQVGDFPKAYVVAVSDNGGHILYKGQGRRAMILKGGLLTATKGLGYDLSAIKHQIDDPVVSPRPVDQWPKDLTRAYQFSLASRDDYEITVNCSHQVAASEPVEIVELVFNLVRIEETCANGRRSFTNTYWAEAGTGFIWKSRQWIGPRHKSYVIEIVRPYGGTG